MSAVAAHQLQRIHPVDNVVMSNDLATIVNVASVDGGASKAAIVRFYFICSHSDLEQGRDPAGYGLGFDVAANFKLLAL